MQEISTLNPRVVWDYFEQILAIPRISKQETKIVAFLEEFARDKGLKHQLDEVGNVLICKDATPGMENRKGIILQSHLDMVGEKHAGVNHDFSTDPILPVLEDGWVKAKGTTLGADDGIGIAAAMAILASDTISHGPLECLFTADEESGMTGALGLRPGFLKGSILLNLDSEDEGEIFIGCAGGIDSVATLKLKRKRTGRNKVALQVKVGGLHGGHSGDEIHLGLGNSIKILNRFLWNADRKFKIQLATLEGGKARNAIPREAEAVILVSVKDHKLVNVYFQSFVEIISKELAIVEPGFTMKMETVALPDSVVRRKQQRKLFSTLYAIPHGPIGMSQEIPGLVETSTNLAAVRLLEGDILEVVTSQRSSVESAKRDLADRMEALLSLLGGNVQHSDGYPGWKPDLDSEVLKISREVYQRLFECEADVKAIHAGLECGLFLQKYPDLDMISFGPTIKGAHTPEERIKIDTVDKFWTFLLEMLEKAPEKI